MTYKLVLGLNLSQALGPVTMDLLGVASKVIAGFGVRRVKGR
jgi:hypothetical protein